MVKSVRQKKNLYYKTDEEVELIRNSCQLVGKTLALVGSLLKPGVSGDDIDKQAEEFIRDHNALPGFKGYRGFPATLCVSLNEHVVHGIPKMQEFKDGDIVSVDCGVLMEGFYGDCAYTFAIGEVNPEIIELLKVTRESLYKGIGNAVAGKRLGDIGHAIQDFAEAKHSYGIVRELVGHGLGRNLHEDPEVPNYGKRGRGMMLRDGLVLAIEPMVNMGTRRVKQSSDGWTIMTADNKPSAHYEHTVVVRKHKADILSTHDFLEEEIRKNPNLMEIA